MNAGITQRQEGVRRAIGAALIGCLFLLAGAVGSTSLAATPDQAPAVDPSQARVWFLRQLIPGSAMDAPTVYTNGAVIAVISQGTVFYRDFAPGNYVFSVDNCRPRANASMTLQLDPGNQFALRVQQDDLGPLDCGPTFTLSPPAPEMLSALFVPLAYLGQK